MSVEVLQDMLKTRFHTRPLVLIQDPGFPEGGTSAETTVIGQKLDKGKVVSVQRGLS